MSFFLISFQQRAYIHFVNRFFFIYTKNVVVSTIFAFPFICVQRLTFVCGVKCVALMQSTERTYKRTHKTGTAFNFCPWIMMNELCDTFDENGCVSVHALSTRRNENINILNGIESRWCAIDVTSRVKSCVSFRWLYLSFVCNASDGKETCDKMRGRMLNGDTLNERYAIV